MEKLILGIEIGGTKLQLAAGNVNGEILKLSQWLLEQIPPFIMRVNQQERGFVEAIGCGFGGPVNSQTGRVLESIQIQGWENFPLRNWLETQFEIPSFVANDSNAATWGEFCLGFGKGSQYFFYTNLGSGVGGGFVFNGALYDGQGLGAGEFGHIYVPDWTSKEPGQGAEIESLCSGWSIETRLNKPDYIPPSSRLSQMRSEKNSDLTPQDLGKAVGIGDPFALQEIDRIARTMGYGLATVLSLTGVERIAIGGGVSHLGEVLMAPIRKYTQQYAFVSNKGRYKISQCELGDKIVLIGAMLLAKNAIKFS